MSKSLGLFSVCGVVCGIEKRALKVGPDVHKHRQKYLVEKLCRVLVSLAVLRKRKRTGIFFSLDCFGFTTYFGTSGLSYSFTENFIKCALTLVCC